MCVKKDKLLATRKINLPAAMLKMNAIQPLSPKIFYPPGTIEELEEELGSYNETKRKLESSAPLLHPTSPQLSLAPTIVNLSRVHTSPSLARVSTKDSINKDFLTRVSSCNSSLYYSPSSIRYNGSKSVGMLPIRTIL
ncbi:hypothetical protein NQ315_013323 [Exocentrus adspersus]|uniref:Uncharacterized protein n=1 Tax=Exocentrus adspersus TaxID=1586481 RepID=A0AAV8V798_9CUCU|nr:hypothetical protein NQ315_013323 [Exocentrus adspersus]